MKKNILLIGVATSLLFSSCLTTKTSVGGYREAKGTEYTYSKGKQMWLFWGLVPIGRTDVNTPSNGKCEVVTRYNFGDCLITGLTAGIVSSYSIKVKAKQ
jgi:hypothetical protein